MKVQGGLIKPDEYTLLSTISKKIGKERDAIRFFGTSDLAKDDSQYRRNASIAQFEAGNVKRSLELLVPVFKDNTSDPALLGILAKGLAFISEKERAAGIFNEAARLRKEVGESSGLLSKSSTCIRIRSFRTYSSTYECFAKITGSSVSSHQGR